MPRIRISCHIQNLFIRCIISCSLFIAYTSYSQEYVYRDKLLNIFPNNFNREINCLATDDKGYLWAGTNFGLFRYDGYNTDPYIFYNKDSLSLSPEINSIVYNNKKLILGTTNGIYIIETNKDEYISRPIKNTIAETISCVYADSISGIWWISKSGNIGNEKNGKTQYIKLPANINTERSFITGNTEHIYMCFGSNQLMAINKKTYKVDHNIIFNELNSITAITFSPNNEKLLSTDKGIYKYDDTKQIKITRMPEYGNNARFIIFADDHIFIHRYNSSIEHLYKKNNALNSKTILVNIDNNLHASRMQWYNNQLIMPGRTGIGVFQINKNHFKQLATVTNTINGDSRGIAEDDENYYLCTYHSIIKYNKKNKQAITISKESLISHGVYREKDTLWIASESKGLIQFNLKTYKSRQVYNDTNQKYLSLLCIKPLNKDSLIIGGYRHIYIYNKANGKITEITPLNKNKQSLSNGYFRQIEIIDQQTIIAATANGVYKIGIDGHLIQKYGNQNQSVIPDNSNCLWINSKKQVWAGTSDGLVIFDSNGQFLTRIGYQNGLAGNKIAGMLPDNLGNLWVGTYSGLSCISISDLEIKNFYTEDGLPDNEFNHSSFYVNNNAKLLMGTMRGFIEIDPVNIKNNKNSVSSISVSKIESEKNGKMESLLITNEIPINNVLLGKEIKYVKLFICRLPLQLFSEINFSYKILKLIPQSVDISDKPIITLTDSEPGKFDIEITISDGKGSNGIYNKILSYHVSEYFYLNKWFYFFSFLFFLLLAIAYLYTLIVQKNKNINIRKEIARDLHDEIGGSLTAISLYTELLREDKAPTRKQINSIQQTTRKLLLSFRDALWTLNTESDNALQLWDHIKDMVSEITGDLPISIKFEEPAGLEKIKLTMKIKQNLLLALKEGINNALKHGDRQSIMLLWKINNENHSIIISNSINNINPFNKFTISTGIGLDSMKKRMQDIGGSISYTSNENNFIIQYHLNFLS